MIIGSRGSVSRASSAAKPSISGICTSRKTRSGASDLMAATASWPRPASPIISTSSSPSNNWRMRSRASGSSSTIKTLMGKTSVNGSLILIGRILDLVDERNLQRDDQSVGLVVFERQHIRVAIRLFEAGARVAQSNARFESRRRAILRCDPRPVVRDPHLQSSVVDERAQADLARRVLFGDSMADGVLDQWLQDQIWKARIEQRRPFVFYFQPDLQTVFEAHSLDVQIEPQKFQFLPEGRQLLAAVLQRQTQKVSEPRHHLIGGVNILMKQSRDRIERIEQEVRLQLHLQRLQLSLGQLRRQDRRLHFAFPEFALIIQVPADNQHNPIEEEVQQYRVGVPDFTKDVGAQVRIRPPKRRNPQPIMEGREDRSRDEMEPDDQSEMDR